MGRMSDHQLLYHDKYSLTKSLLRTLRSKEAAVSRLTADGVPMADSYELVTYVMRRNLASGRTNGLRWAMGGVLTFALFCAILICTGRFYFIIIPIALFTILKGLWEAISTNEWDG